MEKQTRQRVAACEACQDIKLNGLSYMSHTCGQTFSKSPWNGFELEKQGF